MTTTTTTHGFNVQYSRTHRWWKDVWDWGQNHGFWGTGPPAGSRGRAPVWGLGDKVPQGLGDKVPQQLKNFKSSYKQLLRIFGSISHIFTYIMPMFFSCACRHHSTACEMGGGI